MSIYQTLYYQLFNAITDALATMEQGHLFEARTLLVSAQQQTEEAYLAAGEEKEELPQQNS